MKGIKGETKAIVLPAAMLLMIFFQCVPSGSGEQIPTPQSPNAEIVWIVNVPEGFVRTLFTEEALTNESCWDCVIGELERGTELAPRWKGCQEAEWDSSFTYCHIKVLTGDLTGKLGWINVDGIAEATR